MPDKKNTSQEHESVVQPFLELWSSYLERTMEATKAILEGSFSQVRDHAKQKESFEAVSKSLDDFLRSPVFLQAMKQHVDSIIEAKRAGINLATTIDQDENLTSDDNINEILQRFSGTEQMILNRLDQIERRLDKIETHMDMDALTKSEKQSTRS
ncbi:MAG: hypothetical protein MI725_03645 [Pirellulales bacterium]|nr:hypothetical protein [Pirellulales bacterium]